MKVFVAAQLRGRDLVETRENLKQARRIAGDLLRNGHLPLVPHYFAERHVLDPFSVYEDAIGRAAGLALLELADEVHFHGDLTPGMLVEERHAHFIAERRQKRGLKPKPLLRYLEDGRCG